MMDTKRSNMTPETDFIMNKARHFCSFRERCIREVTDKLREWQVRPAVAEKVLEKLVEEDYLNEERFARFFASGKFRINHWGRNKIIHELNRRDIPELIIQIGLEEIDEKEYRETLHEMLARKNREIKDKDPMARKKKLVSFALQKGYEYVQVIAMTREII